MKKWLGAVVVVVVLTGSALAQPKPKRGDLRKATHAVQNVDPQKVAGVVPTKVADSYGVIVVEEELGGYGKKRVDFVVTRNIPAGSYLWLTTDEVSPEEILQVDYDLYPGYWYSVFDGYLGNSFSTKSTTTFKVWVVTPGAVFVAKRTLGANGYSFLANDRVKAAREVAENGAPVLVLSGKFDSTQPLDIIFGWTVVSPKAILSRTESEVRVDMRVDDLMYYSTGGQTITVGNGTSSGIVFQHEYMSEGFSSK